MEQEPIGLLPYSSVQVVVVVVAVWVKAAPEMRRAAATVRKERFMKYLPYCCRGPCLGDGVSSLRDVGRDV